MFPTHFKVKGRDFNVWAIKDECGNVDYYDAFDSAGSCINEGDPIWDFPTQKDMEDLVAKLDESNADESNFVTFSL